MSIESQDRPEETKGMADPMNAPTRPPGEPSTGSAVDAAPAPDVEGLSSESHRSPHDTEATHGGNESDIDEKLAQGQSQYSDEGFWKKTKKYAKKAGEKTMSPALKMYYAAQDPDTPGWAKTTIYGALGYFILPVDAIPDIAPAIGYTDDIGVLAGAIGVVASHVKEEHIGKAKETLQRWFS